MAHFVKLGIGNKVIQGVVVHNDVATSEQAGIDFLNNLFKTNDIWKQTSYNTYGGEHKLGGTPFRKNHAAIGYTYDEDRDAFIPKKLYNSWTLNETTCLWEAPIPEPQDGNHYHWNEETQQWDVDS